MSRLNIVLPAMGEGVIEATINKWLISEGTSVSEDDPLVEVATDKVDSEVPSPAAGVIIEIKASEGSVVRIGDTIAVIETKSKENPADPEKVEKEVERIRETINATRQEKINEAEPSRAMKSRTPGGKFLSPLVRNIAASEGISYSELDKFVGTGMDGRITRDDIIRITGEKKHAATRTGSTGVERSYDNKNGETAGLNVSSGDKIIEMDRVRSLIADHMVMSKRTSAHVTSFIDADVTLMVRWREKIKDNFLAREGQKLTLTPVFIDAVARSLNDFPMLNVSVDGRNIIMKKNINIGIATALPDGNLIVPVIKNANEKNLTGLALAVNDLAERARKNRLKPDEITGGTFTVTNFGTYNNLSGTPIINQPQVAILGTGAIRKMPAVIETPEGDSIAIRHIMILSLSYDHRVIDGALAGKFLNRIREILENYSPDTI